MSRKPKPHPVRMPDFTAAESGHVEVVSGSLSTGAGEVCVTLTFESRTKKTTPLESVTIPGSFDRDQDRFDACYERGKPIELKQSLDVRGKLTVKRHTKRGDDHGEQILGYLPARLVRQVLICDEPGKARAQYKFEFGLAPAELEIVGEVMLTPSVELTFELDQPSLRLAQDLEGEA